MLWNLDPSWLLLAVVVVVILSFVLGLFLDHIMGGEGFGATGNMVVVATGFFLGILAANIYGIRLNDMKMATIIGVSGGFVSLFALAAVKGLIIRR